VQRRPGRRGDLVYLDPPDVSGLRGDQGFVSHQADAFDEAPTRSASHSPCENPRRCLGFLISPTWAVFRLSWSHYALLVRTDPGRPSILRTEALRAWWMRRQIEERRKLGTDEGQDSASPTQRGPTSRNLRAATSSSKRSPRSRPCSLGWIASRPMPRPASLPSRQSLRPWVPSLRFSCGCPWCWTRQHHRRPPRK
jgi:hypothetical protein